MKSRRSRLTCRYVNGQSPRLCEPLCNSGPVSGSAGNKERLLLRTAPKCNLRSTLFALPQPESRRGAQLRQVSAVIPSPGGPGVRIRLPPAVSPFSPVPGSRRRQRGQRSGVWGSDTMQGINHASQLCAGLRAGARGLWAVPGDAVADIHVGRWRDRSDRDRPNPSSVTVSQARRLEWAPIPPR